MFVVLLAKSSFLMLSLGPACLSDCFVLFCFSKEAHVGFLQTEEQKILSDAKSNCPTIYNPFQEILKNCKTSVSDRVARLAHHHSQKTYFLKIILSTSNACNQNLWRIDINIIWKFLTIMKLTSKESSSRGRVSYVMLLLPKNKNCPTLHNISPG